MIRLGMLTPSSNTVLEPVTYALLESATDAVTAHFARFKVTEIGLGNAALAQFDAAPILEAAKLLAHAKCDVITWNGTSASWLGFDRDMQLAESITRVTGIKATTCVLGYRDLLRRLGASTVGLVTPYMPDVQARIIDVWGSEGFACVSEAHCGLAENFSFAEVSEAHIEAMIREVAVEGCEAIAIVCTNMRGAAVAARLEAEMGLPILDSVAVSLWTALDAAKASKALLADWGRAYKL